jgi:hypothetical protein
VETTGIWSYRQDSGYQRGTDLSGYAVEATDGHIGNVEKHTDEAEAGRVVVATGSSGGHALLPAGVLSSIDPTERVVHAACTKDEITNAPEFHRALHEDDPEYHQRVGSYYARLTP